MIVRLDAIGSCVAKGICDYRQWTRARALARTKVIDNAFDKGLRA